MRRGWFITFEGGEGTGKSTQLRLLQQWLERRGAQVEVTREPGGTGLAEAIRALLLDPRQEPDGLSELFLLAAARRDHVVQVIAPALERGEVVLCDRFADSSLVYQGMVRRVGEEVTGQVNQLATGGLEPDLTIVLDMDPEVAVTRARLRNADCDDNLSRLDDEPDDFHRRIAEGYRRLAELLPHRVRVVDAAADEETVFERLLVHLPEELQ
jgi:dTMP kinase